MWLLRKLAFPISLVYGVIVHLRNYFFTIGWLPVNTFDTPIISVGNLSVGGTGKTPMIEFLIRNLSSEYRIAVLSRGYKRKSRGFLLADESTSVQELGDEPFQIKRKFKDVAVAVDANRSRGITILEKIVGPQIILLDDAFQHRKVLPTFSLLLTTYSCPYHRDWYLPTGNLRDAKHEAKRASAIVVTKCPPLSEEQKTSLELALRKDEQQPVYFSFLSYEEVLHSDGGEMSITQLQHKEFTLITGIANPKPLVDHLKDKGLRFHHLEFSDHHFFTKKELEKINNRKLVVTTEKDYVRLQGKVDPLYYIRISHRFMDEGGEQLMQQIRERLTLYSLRSP